MEMTKEQAMARIELLRQRLEFYGHPLLSEQYTGLLREVREEIRALAFRLTRAGA